MINNTAMAKRLATLPNYLTAFRVVILPLLAFLIMTHRPIASVFLLTLAGLSDFFDGWVARRNREESDVGRLMDTVADKVLLCVAIIFLVADPLQPLDPWLATLLLAREFLVNGLRAMAASVGVIMGAAATGKLKMVTQFFGLGGIMLGQLPGRVGENFRLTGLILLWISVGLSYFSMAQYLRRAYVSLRNKLN